MSTRAAATQHRSLPIVRTRLIGREDEIAAGRTFLLDEAAPLLTVSGPGGVGKTRLILAVGEHAADAFAGGAVWVDLSPLTDPALVPRTVAAALGLTPIPDRPDVDNLVEYLRPRQTLLVLDNCEHVLDAVAALTATLLAACPALQVLASSRAPLRVRGEQVFPLDPLPLPPGETPSLPALERSPAVRLFLARARAAHPSFALTPANAAAVAALCRRLDGLPLAIELAAARIGILSPEALLGQVDDRLTHLAGGPRDLPTRQQTIAAAIAWSHDLLDPAARVWFRRLAVFSGGFTLEAAQYVAGSDGEPSDTATGPFARLLDHSLVRRMDLDGEPRFTMLETIRAFALEHLQASGEEDAIRERHAAHYLERAPILAVDTLLPRELGWVEHERANIRSAMTQLEDEDASERLLILASAVAPYWTLYGDAVEARRWLERGLAVDAPVTERIRGRALASLAAVLFQLHGETASALARGEEALALTEKTGDAPGLVQAAHWCGLSAMRLGQAERGEAFFAQAQAAARVSELTSSLRTAAHLDNLRGQAAMAQGEIDRAEQLFATARDREREQEAELGLFPFLAYALIGLGHVARCRGNAAGALGAYQEGLAVAARFRDVRSTAPGLAGVAGSLAALGRWREAATLFGATEGLCRRTGMPFADHALAWQRAAGLPEPWQQADAPVGWLDRLRAAVVAGGVPALPPLPDPDAAAAAWAAGRALPLDEAIGMALAARSDTAPAAPLPASTTGLTPPAGVDLTRREREVLALLCQRLTDPEIAERLFVGTRTASSHVSNILAKLGAANRREAAALAARYGLV
jgi:predicted ATPase/DNA-binding CsgD family transcriptional regulator